MSRRREQARQLLKHYLTVAMTKEPDEINIDNDVNAELDEIADLIIEAAVEEAIVEVEARFAVNRRRHTKASDKIQAAEEAANDVPSG